MLAGGRRGGCRLAKCMMVPTVFGACVLLLCLSHRAGSHSVQQRIQGAIGRRLNEKWDRQAAYLGMCLVVKDQHLDIREWVAHHLAIGASTIYVYDHLSQPPLSDILSDHIASGTVHHIWWNHTFGSGEYGAPPNLFNNPQMHAYQRCLADAGPRHQFLGFLDTDEFLVLRNTSGADNVPDFLRVMMAQRTIGGLAVPWRIFGSSGHQRRPEQGVLHGFTQCTPEDSDRNKIVKVLANTDFAVQPHRHNFRYNCSQGAVNERFQPVKGTVMEPSVMNTIVVNHYQIKSAEEFEEKLQRGGGTGRQRPKGLLKKIDKICTEVCDDALKYGPYV